MTDGSQVQVRIQPHEAGEVAYVIIDNVARLNIIDSRIMIDFVDAVGALSKRDALRVVVLTGAGDKAFIGGANIHEMVALKSEQAEAFITRLHQMCDALRNLPVPVIARINGYALGAGLEVAAACDLRVAASSAVFGMPEVKVGIPSVIEAALLPGLIGWGRTRELVLLGENFGAEEALRWGMVEKVVEPAALDAAVDAWVASLLRAGPRAIRLQKRLVRQWEDLPLSQAIQAGITCFAQAYATDEPVRMMRAFTERKREKR